MHITAIKRAYDGGLRLMVASATDNELLSDLWNLGYHAGGNTIPVPDSAFDFNSAVRQLQFIHTLVAANNSWMQIVTTPTEARNAINNNKLAVILGLELDSLSLDQVATLASNYQVRSVIPVHLANSRFGGMAMYDDVWNANNYFYNGMFFDVSLNNCVSFRLGVPKQLQRDPNNGVDGALSPQPISASWFDSLHYQTQADLNMGGHVNNMSLNRGAFFQLMQWGLLLDIAHMGQNAADAAISMGELHQYPVMDSHTGLRDDSNCAQRWPNGPPPGVSERSMPFSQVKLIAKLGGVLGLGTARNDGPDPVESWLKDYQEALIQMGGKGVALGTDTNGLSPQIVVNQYDYRTTYPITIASRFNPPPGVDTPSLPRFTMGARTYDFTHDGIANYGLLPDFLQAVSEHPDFHPLPRPACNAACQNCVKSVCDPGLKECEGAGGPGFIRGETVITLTDSGTGTRVSYTADLQVGGLIASVGQRMLGGVSKMMADKFFNRMSELLQA